MRIAILTSGILPVPAVQGGAVETLIDSYLAYNRKHRLHDITVYSTGSKNLRTGSDDSPNRYVYIDIDSPAAKIRKHLFRLTHGEGYYYFGIEYYLDRALKHIRRARYDIIIIENRPGFALRIPDDIGAKLVLHLHNDFLNTATHCAREISGQLSRIVCVSDYISGMVRQIEPDSGKIVTVHNGIDTEAFCRKAGAGMTRERLGLKPDDFVIIFTGRIIPEKGIAELIEAIALLERHEDIKLIVTGKSILMQHDDGGRFLASLREKAAMQGDRIVFTGHIPHSAIAEYLHLADIAALPSTWEEPFGLTCVEAMAAGLPVITTDKGGLPEITTSDCAITVATGEGLSRRLAAAILELYSSPDRRRSMGKAAAERAQLFTEERYAEAFFHALDGMLD